MSRRSSRTTNPYIVCSTKKAGGVQAKSSGTPGVLRLLDFPLSESQCSEDQICRSARMYLARKGVDGGEHRVQPFSIDETLA